LVGVPQSFAAVVADADVVCGPQTAELGAERGQFADEVAQRQALETVDDVVQCPFGGCRSTRCSICCAGPARLDKERSMSAPANTMSVMTFVEQRVGETLSDRRRQFGVNIDDQDRDWGDVV
jgi:hypothetical protein